MDNQSAKALKQELKGILAKGEAESADALVGFLKKHSQYLPTPGENPEFDELMWQASEYIELDAKDKAVVKRVTDRLMAKIAEAEPAEITLALRELIGAGKEKALQLWHEALLSMSWQQLRPVAVTRSVGKQIVSLGTIERDLAGAKVELNLGWLVDDAGLRILLQAKDNKDVALPNLEMRIKEMERGVIYESTTDIDGSIVENNVPVGPGRYRIEISWSDSVAITPCFVISAS